MDPNVALQCGAPLSGDCPDSRRGLSPSGERPFHETACTDQPCTIGRGTTIGPFAHVMRGATIGEDCQLGRGVVVAPTALIGRGVRIGEGVSVCDGVVLEDGVFCGSGVVFATVPNPRSDRGLSPCSGDCPDSRGTVPVFAQEKRDCPLSEVGRGLSPCSGDCPDFCEEKMGLSPSQERPGTAPLSILIKRGASLGANATILGGSTVHDCAMVEAGAVVTGDVLRYALVAGVPARQIGWVCRCGVGRLSFEGSMAACCPACGRHYRLQPHHGLEEFSPDEERADQRERVLRAEAAHEAMIARHAGPAWVSRKLPDAK